jgi:hypothetical protein
VFFHGWICSKEERSEDVSMNWLQESILAVSKVWHTVERRSGLKFGIDEI